MKIRPVVLAVLMAVPLCAWAHDYDYIDGGMVDGDGPRGDEQSDLGLRLSGSADIADPVALFGEIVDADDFTHLTGGAMFHTPLSQAYGLEINAGGSLEMVDYGPVSDTGLGLRAGLRWWVPNTMNRFEINPELRHLYVFDSPSTSLRNNLLYRVTANLNLQGAVQIGDDDRAELGMRYEF